MSEQVLLFLVVCGIVGGVNLILGERGEKSLPREFLSFGVVVIGGICLFTAAIVIVSGLFQ